MENTSHMASYKDRKKDVMSWEDVHFRALNKVFDARQTGDNLEFQRSVNALYITLSGFIDEPFEKDMWAVDRQKQILAQADSETSANEYYYDEKAHALSRLIFRINKGERKSKEYIEDSEIVKELAYKLTHGYGQNIFITGKPGTGKSYTAIKIGSEVSKLTGVDFGIDNVVFTPSDFAKLYNDINKVPEGAVIVFDEIGVSFNSRDALQKANKVFSKMLQIIRHRCILVIFTAPALSYMDSAGRMLLHWWLEADKLDKVKGICYIKPHLIEVVQRTGEVLTPYPRFYDNVVVTELRVNQINDNTARAYELRAAEYKSGVSIQAQVDLANLDNLKKDSVFLEFKQLRDTGLTRTDVMKKLKLTSHKATKYEKLYLKIKLI